MRQLGKTHPIDRNPARVGYSQNTRSESVWRRSVLGRVPKCPGLCAKVSGFRVACRVSGCEMSDFREISRRISRESCAPEHSYSHSPRTSTCILRAHLPHHAYSFRAKNSASSHMHLYGKLYCRVLPVLVVLYVVRCTWPVRCAAGEVRGAPHVRLQWTSGGAEERGAQVQQER